MAIETILVCFAVREEAAPFSGIASTHGERLKILTTGMGSANALRGLEAALREHRPAMVVTCGFAGGLNPKLMAGQVVFEADSATGLDSRLKAAGAVAVKFHCATRVAITAAEKAELWKSTGADAVEMESGAIRAKCQSAGIPAATIRVISDAAGEDLPLDFNALMTPDMRMNWARLALAVAASPGKIPLLMRFQRQTSSAAKRLAEALGAALIVQP